MLLPFVRHPLFLCHLPTQFTAHEAISQPHWLWPMFFICILSCQQQVSFKIYHSAAHIMSRILSKISRSVEQYRTSRSRSPSPKPQSNSGKADQSECSSVMSRAEECRPCQLGTFCYDHPEASQQSKASSTSTKEPAQRSSEPLKGIQSGQEQNVNVTQIVIETNDVQQEKLPRILVNDVEVRY